VLDRWTQLEPTVLFADNAVFYNGRVHNSMEKLAEVVKGLPTLKHIVVLHKFAAVPADLGQLEVNGSTAWLEDAFLASAQDINKPLEFLQLEPDWPVYILFSSGTTGSMALSSCMRDGKGLTWTERTKVHLPRSYWDADTAQEGAHAAVRYEAWRCVFPIHDCDLWVSPPLFFFSFFFFFSRSSVDRIGMMWHWLVSGLASGLTVVLYDGSPFRPFVGGSGDLAMAKLIEEFGYAVVTYNGKKRFLSSDLLT
jgi:acetoacetyl-CoA synthetase